MSTACIVVLLALTGSAWCEKCPVENLTWTYQDIDAWKDLAEDCGKENMQQSPIDLCSAECGNSGQPQVWQNEKTWRVIVENNGRTLKLVFDCFGQKAGNGALGPLTLSESGEKYDLAEVHFHWGKEGEDGSEHAIEGEKFTAEAHLKFTIKTGDVAADALSFAQAKYGVGLVLAVGIPLVDSENISDGDLKFPTFGLTDEIKKVRTFNSRFDIDIKVKPLKKLLDKALTSVYKYIGSLTTPPCTLQLPWLVSKEPARIKPKFLTELRQLLRDEDGNPIERNVRPLQKYTDKLEVCLHEG